MRPPLMLRRREPFANAVTAFFLLTAAPVLAAENAEPQSLLEDGRLEASEPARIELPAEKSGEACAVTVWLRDPAALRREGSTETFKAHRLEVRIESNGEPLAHKFLHTGDPDLFAVIPSRPRTVLTVGRDGQDPPKYGVQVTTFSVDSKTDGSAAIEVEPNDGAEQATGYRLGRTVFASADDRPFIAAPGQDEEAAKKAGVDWYTFRHEGPDPTLAFFWIDFLDREVPVDVAIFHKQDGELVRYDDDFERFEPERSTNYAGMYKFVARRLTPGRYWLRVRANHPEYRLRSETAPVPPFDPEEEGGVAPAARKAVRLAQDYILLKGESWHANTPRVGGVDNRVRNVHAETAQCIACHPTHFATRGAVFSIANGYPVRRRESLRFLAERLYNNPRPLLGQPQAHWSRMISAAGNVVSRLSIMLQVFEEHVSGRPRTGVHKDVAEYLKLYYRDREKLPGDESNGNRPLVSNFEVALHSWMVFDELHRRTGDETYAKWRKKVRGLIESGDGQIKDMLDLCYQTIAFCRIDKDGYADRIKRNVERILKHQRDDGQWPMRFGDDQPSAEFQTAHCLYTLALAGVPVEDPHVKKAMRYLLKRQKPFGAWYDDDDPDHPHPYENFQTPFRETQFVLMAFSQYFPGPEHARGPHFAPRDSHGAQTGDGRASGGWQAAYDAPPDRLDGESTARLLQQLDNTWVANGPAFERQVVDLLDHDNPLIRRAAAACLGRIGGEAVVEPLIERLGDPSKLVRRAAAWALRQLGNRDLGQQAVAQALESDNHRIRRGAMQIFAQHGRYWTDRGEIARTLIEKRMNDPDPYVRMLACRSLWQWWYWAPSDEIKSAIEDAFLGRMAEEAHPWVRTNLIDGFYNVCDENIRYLYNNWIPRLGTQEARQKAKDGEHAARNRQARKIAEVLRNGNEKQIETVLRAVGFFHLRSGTYARRGRFSRIGNDVETVQFYRESADELKSALKPHLNSESPDIRGPALLAGYTLRGTGSEDVLGLPYLKALNDPDDDTRGVAVEFYDNFLPPVNEETEPQVLKTVDELLDSEYPAARRAALQLVGRLNFSKDGRKQFARSIRDFLAEGDTSLLPQALQAVAGLPELWDDSQVLLTVVRALRSDDEEILTAAVKLSLKADPLGAATAIRARLDELFESDDPEIQKMLLELAVSDREIRDHSRVATLVSNALTGEDATARSQALDLVRNGKTLQNNAAVRAALSQLLEDPNERTRQLAQAVYKGQKLPTENLDPSELLDYEYFKRKVQPIFFAEGPDGQACYQCHHNHGILKLTGPKDGELSEAITRQNYRSALRVVDLAEPEKSLLLRKPLAGSATEGTVGALSHGGEVRWPDGEKSEAYQTIRAWLNGAQLDAGRNGDE